MSVCSRQGEIMQKLFSIYQNGITINVYDSYVDGFVTFEIKGQEAIVQSIDLYDAVICIKTGEKDILNNMWTCNGFKTLLKTHGLI